MKFTVKMTVLALAAIMILPMTANAESHGQYYDYVTKVNVGTDNYLYINVLGNFSINHGCVGPWFVRSQYPLTDERTKAWLQEFASTSFVYHKRFGLKLAGVTAALESGIRYLQNCRWSNRIVNHSCPKQVPGV